MKQVYESDEVQTPDGEGGYEECTFKVYRDYRVGRGKVVAGFTVVKSGQDSGDTPMITYPNLQTGQHSAITFAEMMQTNHAGKPAVRRRVHRGR